MYLPNNEIERIAVSVITEFGADAERAASNYAKSARDRGFEANAQIWEQVRERIANLRGDAICEVPRAA